MAQKLKSGRQDNDQISPLSFLKKGNWVKNCICMHGLADIIQMYYFDMDFLTTQ
jgi:hypothetical protein